METKQSNGLGTAGMVIGIIALITSCIVIGGFLGIVGLILSIVAITQKNKKSGTAIAGIILNSIAIVIMILMFALAGSDDVNTTNTNNETVSPETETIATTMASDALSEITDTPDTQQTEQESQPNDTTTELSSENTAIELIAGEQGQYGKLITMSEGTDMEESFYVYYVPSGTYTVTNEGEYMTQISVYEGFTKNEETGYDEYTTAGSIVLLDTDSTDTIEVPDGWFIEIQEPAHISLAAE